MIELFISNFILDKKTVLFAINNTCNCRCDMCSIWKYDNKKIVKLIEGRKALSKLYKNNFGSLQITGGEPLLNSDVYSIIDYAKKLNFIVFLVTNGTLINELTAKKLSESRVDNVGISFHHYDNFIFEKISNHKNILSKVMNAVKYLKKENIPVEALFTISKFNKDDIEKTVEFINSLGIGVSFCIPMIIKDTSYCLGGRSAEFSNEELNDVITEIIHLKKKRYWIINNMIFFKEILNFLNGKNKYSCLGGNKLFYLDWNLNLYPCMVKGSPKNIDKVDFNLKGEKCNECLLQCFREPSLFLISRPLAISLILQDLPTYVKMTKTRY